MISTPHQISFQHMTHMGDNEIEKVVFRVNLKEKTTWKAQTYVLVKHECGF